MTDGDIIVDVWNCAASVSRFMVAAGVGRLEPAANADDLEPAAVEAVEAQGGALNLSGWYQCPPDLASQAVWPE